MSLEFDVDEVQVLRLLVEEVSPSFTPPPIVTSVFGVSKIDVP
jgi:hypothetical protein